MHRLFVWTTGHGNKGPVTRLSYASRVLHAQSHQACDALVLTDNRLSCFHGTGMLLPYRKINRRWNCILKQVQASDHRVSHDERGHEATDGCQWPPESPKSTFRIKSNGESLKICIVSWWPHKTNSKNIFVIVSYKGERRKQPTQTGITAVTSTVNEGTKELGNHASWQNKQIAQQIMDRRPADSYK